MVDVGDCCRAAEQGIGLGEHAAQSYSLKNREHRNAVINLFQPNPRTMEGGPPPSAGDMKMPANSGLRSARPRTIPVPVPRGRLPGGPSAAAMGTGPSNGLVGMNAARAPPPRANGQFGFQLNPTLGLSTSRAPPSSAPGSVGGRSPPSTSAGSPPSAASPVQTSGSGLAAKIKVKDEPETITRSNSFRILSSGPMANNALSVMRFPSLEDSTRTDLLNWTPPIKMHRFIPEAIAPDPDDVPAVPRWMQRRNEMGELGGPVPSAVGKAPAEEFDISKVDKKTARRKAKQMTRKLKPWRGPKMLLDEEVNGGAAAAAEAERRIKARAEASMSRLPYLLSDSSLNQEHEFEGKLEQGLAGDQYVLLTKVGLVELGFQISRFRGEVLLKLTSFLFYALTDQGWLCHVPSQELLQLPPKAQRRAAHGRRSRTSNEGGKFCGRLLYRSPPDVLPLIPHRDE